MGSVKVRRISTFMACLLLLSAGEVGASPARDRHYQVRGNIKGPDSRWDLLSVDDASRRLYMARAGGVTSIDLASGRVTPTLLATDLSHGVVPVGAGHLVVANRASTNSLLWFDGRSGKIVGETAVGSEPDGVVYDPFTNTVISINAADMTVVNVATRRAVATIALQGEPEFGVTDYKGRLYDNIRDRNEIAVVDLRERSVVGHIALSDCQEPTGLAYDRPTGLLISVCGSGMAKFVVAGSGRQIASIKVGEGADAVILDSRRRLAFIPSGHSGTLSIFSLRDASHPRLIQVLPTKIGTRTGAVDPATGWLYLPSADFQRPKEGKWPDVVPGSMRILVVAPR